jgi:hypothetical protein
MKLRLFNMQNPRTQSWRAEQSEPLPCSEIDLRNAAVGAKCKTSKNMIFERVFRARFGEAWMGPGGVIWSDRIMTENPQKKPDVDFCARHNGRLPTEHDLAYALKIGAAEVLPNMNTPFFWVTQRGGWASQYEVVTLVSINEKARYDSADYYEFAIRCVGK